MDLLKSLVDNLRPGLPLGVTLAVLAVVVFAANRILERRYATRPSRGYRRQLILLLVYLLGLLVVIQVSPLNVVQKGQLLSLIGILLSAAIALSSTTFLGNAFAGVMLRMVRSFRMGDFVHVGNHFGRVSGRGLFHTEIQTEHRDLITLPNLYLVTKPVKVIRKSGTIVRAEVSLGYDIPRTTVERLLLEAAEAAELTDPFVHVIELGDSSVVYRVAGLLSEVKQLISARSRLREKMLDVLHAGGVEIVSPAFRNNRALPLDRVFIPQLEREADAAEPVVEKSPEATAFDKAEQAESTENLRARYDKMGEQLENLEKQLKDTSSNTEKESLNKRIADLESARDHLAKVVEERTEKLDE